MIPKVIHCCWFGGGKKPELVQNCMASWERHLPGYEIVEWNEDNFDISANEYCRQAHEARKWAFVSDYTRLHVLYHHGGIYMDTDVEVLKSLYPFLGHEAFSGFEQPGYIPAGVIGAQPGNLWVKDHLDCYDRRTFILPNGAMDITTNVCTISALSRELHGLTLDESYQVLTHGVHIYPREWFSPPRIEGKWQITDNTYTIHHFAGSWITAGQRMKTRMAAWIASNLGQDTLDAIMRAKRLLGK